MLEAITSLFSLRYTNPPTYHPLPPNITRTFISNPSTPNTKLELLESSPASSSTSTSPPPLLFIHGGFGSASVWLPFITYLTTTPTPTTTNSTPRPKIYALSLRNHGASTSLSYLRMVWFTTLQTLSSDLSTAVNHIIITTGQAPVLIAHSSGGGLVQFYLTRRNLRDEKPKVPGLVLLDSVPHFGNLGVYANWARHDPWFLVRTLVHAYHPVSPLSSLGLVRGAFFGSGAVAVRKESLSDAQVGEFMRWMPKYESLVWPMQMVGSFWGWVMGTPRWLDVRDVLGAVELWGGESRDRVCVMFGDCDVLMDGGMCRRAAGEFREGIRELRGVSEKMGGGVEEMEETQEKIVERADGVRLVVVKGAGHHVQNDVQWQVAAEELRRFVVQL